MTTSCEAIQTSGSLSTNLTATNWSKQHLCFVTEPVSRFQWRTLTGRIFLASLANTRVVGTDFPEDRDPLSSHLIPVDGKRGSGSTRHWKLRRFHGKQCNRYGN